MSDLTRWKCGRCGAPLDHPNQGHDCAVVVITRQEARDE